MRQAPSVTRAGKRIARHPRMPVRERAQRVLLPCPDVQRVKRRQAVAIRAFEAMGELPHEFRRGFVHRVPGVDEGEEVRAHQAQASVRPRLVDDDLWLGRVYQGPSGSGSVYFCASKHKLFRPEFNRRRPGLCPKYEEAVCVSVCFGSRSASSSAPVALPVHRHRLVAALAITLSCMSDSPPSSARKASKSGSIASVRIPVAPGAKPVSGKAMPSSASGCNAPAVHANRWNCTPRPVRKKTRVTTATALNSCRLIHPPPAAGRLHRLNTSPHSK